MIDATILPLQRRVLAWPAQLLVRSGIEADQVTLGGFAVGLLAVGAIAFGQCDLALALMVLNRLADGLDGAVARLRGPTDRGAFLDIALDFVFYALVPVGFALHDPDMNALPAAVLISAFVGTGSSFLAFSVIAAKRGLTAEAYPSKGIYYLGGLTEGAETIGVFAAMCLWSQSFAILAWIFAAACALTTVMRWMQAWNAFKTSGSVPEPPSATRSPLASPF